MSMSGQSRTGLSKSSSLFTAQAAAEQAVGQTDLVRLDLAAEAAVVAAANKNNSMLRT